MPVQMNPCVEKTSCLFLNLVFRSEIQIKSGDYVGMFINRDEQWAAFVHNGKVTEKAFTDFPSVPLAPCVTIKVLYFLPKIHIVQGTAEIEKNFGDEDFDDNGDQQGDFNFDLKAYSQGEFEISWLEVTFFEFSKGNFSMIRTTRQQNKKKKSCVCSGVME